MSKPTTTVELTENELDMIGEALIRLLDNLYSDEEGHADAVSALNKCETLRVKLGEERMRRVMDGR